nr:MAG TPA: hypothetical protein [Caudoviricetes sp.]
MSSGKLCGRQSTSYRCRLLTCCGRRGLLATSVVVGLLLCKIVRIFHRYIVNTHKIVHKLHAKCLHYECMFAIIKTVKRGTLTIRSTQ